MLFLKAQEIRSVTSLGFNVESLPNRSALSYFFTEWAQCSVLNFFHSLSYPFNSVTCVHLGGTAVAFLKL